MDGESSALLERAASLRRAGRIDEAIAAYTVLLEREPELPDSWYNLGWLQRQARQYEAALNSYGEALKRGVREPEQVHLNRAVILSDHLARHDEAEAELQSALKLRPDYLPALLNLGNLDEDRGNREAAVAAYRRALEVDPGNALALSRFAGVADARSDAAAGLVDDLRRAIAGEADPSARADLGFALGRLLDSRGEYDQAFSAYESANRAGRDSLGPQSRVYDGEAQERFVDRSIAAFPDAAEGRGESAPAIFIVGMFRSGSTLTEQILGAHGRIVSGGELDLVPALASRLDPYPEAVAAADAATIDTWRKFYLDGLKPFARDGSFVTDKRPDNFLHVGLIKTLFPGAKIVHTRRHRLDNLLSLYFLHLDPGMAYALDLADANHWYGQYQRLMAHWKRLYPDDILDVDYDVLVRDPESPLRELLGFLELEWEGGLLDFHRRREPVKTASVWQVREPLHARSSGRWRNYETQLERALGELSGDE
jgi:tetratricopeptide (TPR) repeat protein